MSGSAKASRAGELLRTAALVALPFAGLLLGCAQELNVIQAPSPFAPLEDPPLDYTAFRPSADTRIVYVSSSEGDDANDGLSPETARRTIAAALSLLRASTPDWMLLRRGDHFDEPLGEWSLSGRSALEPIVIASYADGVERPTLDTGARSAIRITSGEVRHVRFVGLRFHAHTRDPAHPAFSTAGEDGVFVSAAASDLLVEDCVFQGYPTGLYFAAEPGLVSDVHVVRSLVLDSWAPEGRFPRGNGIYAHAVDGLVIDSCFFDHNGHHPSAPGGERNLEAHAINVKEASAGAVITNTIITRSNSHGILTSAQGTSLFGNVLSDNPIAVALAGPMTTVSNLVLHGTDIDELHPRAWGITLEGTPSGPVRDNVVAFGHSSEASARPLDVGAGVEYSGNVVYAWPEGAAESPFADPGPFVDPSRDLAAYDASIGGEGTLSHLIDELRAQSRLRARPELSPRAIHAFVAGGYERTDGT